MADQPDWLLANVERYAATLATLTDPREPWTSGGQRTREGQVLRMAECLIAGMNETEEERAAYDRARQEEHAERAARRLRWIADSRIATASIDKLTPNERRRVRRWIDRQPKGEDHPILYLRAGRGARSRAYDFIDVAQAERRYHYLETPYSFAVWAVSEVEKVLGRQLPYAVGCQHSGVYGGLAATRQDWSIPKYLPDTGA